MMADLAKILVVLATIFAGFGAVVVRGGDHLLTILQSARLDDYLSGRLAGKIDRAVFDAIPRSAPLDALAAGLLYRGLHDAGSQVWAGCGDWLFSAEELRVDRHDAANIDARLRLLPKLVHAITSRGILLVVVPVPDKAERLENQLCGLTASASRTRAKRWSGAAATLDLLQPDLHQGWPKPGYWRTDTHWDNSGAAFAANAVADVVNGKLGRGSEPIKLVTGQPHERTGDLARLAGLLDAPRWLGPVVEHAPEIKLDIRRAGGLLDEATAPSVLLAGSSFSLNSSFIEYLQTALGREVGQVSQAGGGFAGALLEVLQQKPAILASTKVVIWELPMRSLVTPLTDAERRMLEADAT